MLFRRLVAKTDVLVENFSPRVMATLGLDYATLEKVNPALVMTSISPFGQTGPYKDYEGGDLVEQAVGGWMYAGGTMDREPLKAGGSLSDYVGGLSGAVATMTAVLACRGGNSGGQHVDVSIQENMVVAQAYLLLAQSYRGLTLPRMGSPFPFTILPCKNGYIGVNILTHGQWTLLCQFMGVPELLDNPNYQDGMSRLFFGKEITDVLRPRLMEKTAEELFHEGQSWRIPFCFIPTTEELLGFEQHKEREFFVAVDHPQAGTVRQPGAPFKMSTTPWRIRCPAPLLGQHNKDVYGSYLGLAKEDLVRLRRDGVI
jgi:CoA:oxalate CoA-transferase